MGKTYKDMRKNERRDKTVADREPTWNRRKNSHEDVEELFPSVDRY